MSMPKRSGRPDAHAIIDGMNLKAAMIAPQYSGLAMAINEMASADVALEEAAWEIRRNELCKAYGFAETQADKPFAFANGVAIIPVHGVLINRFSRSWGFVTGYQFLRAQRAAAEADDDVKLIVYDCNSPGGMVAGCFETADAMYEGRKAKPSMAVVDSSAYSACYAIASAADRIVATPSSGVGSIGVVATHVNIGELLSKWGVEITFIHAGEHKVDGHPYAALPDNVKASIQRSIDKNYSTFVGAVARNRGLDEKAVRDTEAQTYDADDALAIGLIDAVQTPSEAVAAYLDELSGSDDQQEIFMSKTTDQPGANTATPSADTAADDTAARQGERERIAGIMNCDEAKGKSKLANHLALSTDMSVDAAKAILSAASAEAQTTDKSADTPAATKPAANPFAAAMDTSDHPAVGSGGNGGEGGQGEQSASARILAAQSAATGRKLAS